jgi:hypothetical protein
MLPVLPLSALEIRRSTAVEGGSRSRAMPKVKGKSKRAPWLTFHSSHGSWRVYDSACILLPN